MSDVSQPSTVITLTNVAPTSLAAGFVTDQFVLPFNAELLNVSIYAGTGPTVSNGTYDIFVAPPGTAIGSATTIFPTTTALGTLAQAIDNVQTVIYVSVAATQTATQVLNQVTESVVTPPIVVGQVILVGTEIMKVTGIAGGAAAFGVGGGTSQSKIVYDPNLLALTVTRGFLSSTAASAVINASVLAQLPTLAFGAVAISTTNSVFKPSLPLLVAGSVVQVKVINSGTANASNGSFTFHLAKR